MYFINRYKSLESYKDILFLFLKSKLHTKPIKDDKHLGGVLVWFTDIFLFVS